jgi:hypothetical protein
MDIIEAFVNDSKPKTLYHVYKHNKYIHILFDIKTYISITTGILYENISSRCRETEREHLFGIG